MIGRFEAFCAAISSITNSIQKIERMEMAKYGLKGPHAQCILALGRFPEGLTAARLCELCEKDKAAISRAVTELTKANMISRLDPDGKHYRSCLTLTEKGREVAEQLSHRVHMVVARATAGYGPEDRQAFVRVLNTLVGNLHLLSRDGLTPTAE